MRGRATLACMLLATAISSHAAPPTRFDAHAEWQRFDELVRLDYAYFERPGVDGQAILEHFAPQARRAPDAAAFIAVLKRVARNFADPHFNVGPFAPGDPSVVPTVSDLAARRIDGRSVVVDVRAGSAAARHGVRPGAVVAQIDGRSPEQAVEALLGRPAGSLSTAQFDHGLNIALAGAARQPRRLRIDHAGQRQALVLEPASEQAAAVARSEPLTWERRGALGIVRIHNSLGDAALVPAFDRALDALADTQALVIDLRNTPSGGNTSVARGLMGRFVEREMPYQTHVVPGEQRRTGVGRKFVELVLPRGERYRGQVFVAGGRWTGSMGEGLMIGFQALGARTAGSRLGHLLGAMFVERLEASGAVIELGEEQLLDVNGRPREDFVPTLYVEPAEAIDADDDPVLRAVLASLRAGSPPATAASR